MTEFEDFKSFEKEGWEERASTYDKWASANLKFYLYIRATAGITPLRFRF